jgi:hypothetical protein
LLWLIRSGLRGAVIELFNVLVSNVNMDG